MAGFNRRFAPLALEIKQFFGDIREPLHIQYRVNAGILPLTHWLHDPVEGGGRLIGEGCHFIDWMTWLNGSLPESAVISALPDAGSYREDNFSVTVQFKNGSLGTLHYLANGNRSAPKEYVEVSSAGSMALLNDFRSLTLFRDGAKWNLNGGVRQDKGHQGAWKAFLRGIQSGERIIPYPELLCVAELAIRLADALRSGGSGQQVKLG
jgi:predicted dehydrogenase